MLADRFATHLRLLRSFFSNDLLAQRYARLTNVYSVRANGQVGHLLLVLPAERAAHPLLILWCLGAAAQGCNTLITDRDLSGSGNEALHLVLLFVAKRAHQCWLPLVFEDLDDVRSYLLQAEAKALQHSCAYTLAFPEHSQEEVFGAEKVVVEAPCFIDGKLHHFFRPWGQAYFAGHEVFSTAHNAFDGLTRLVEINPHACEHFACHAFPLTKQAQQEVLGADGVVLEALRLFLGELHDRAGPFGEAVEVPSLVRGCCGSLPTGASPPVRCQPSAYRADKMVRCHLLILSVSLLLLTRRASSDFLWSPHLSHRRALCVQRGMVLPIVCAGVSDCAPPGNAAADLSLVFPSH